MEKILITGADGFLGSHLTDFCLNNNKLVYALKKPDGLIKNLYNYTNKRKKYCNEMIFGNEIQITSTNKNLKILDCNIKNGPLLEKIIEEIKPIYIFHFAAQPFVIPSWEDPKNTIETNVIGTINIFEALKKHDIQTRVIIACSSAEYGTTTEINRPLKEKDQLLAIHPYGISKIAAELLARQYFINFGIECIVLRYFNQTGPRKLNDACSDFITKIAQIELGLTEPIIQVGDLSPYRDITGVQDSIQATWLAATKGKVGETYNICSGRKIQIRDVLKIALSFSKKNIKVIENTPKKLRKTDEDTIVGDNSKIRDELGFIITQSIQEILKDMFDYWIEYYKTN